MFGGASKRVAEGGDWEDEMMDRPTNEQAWNSASELLANYMRRNEELAAEMARLRDALSCAKDVLDAMNNCQTRHAGGERCHAEKPCDSCQRRLFDELMPLVDGALGVRRPRWLCPDCVDDFRSEEPASP